MPAIIERKNVSPGMQKALQAHIIREREKRKQEVAKAEKDSERKAKEEEEKRKKIEEENSTLEDIKEQLTKLGEKLVGLREEKHQLFWQFKRVLNEESKRKQRLREQSEAGNPASHFTSHGMNINPHMMGQGTRLGIHPQTGYLTQGSPSMQQGVKRPHSPNPPPSGVIQMYARPNLSMHASPQHKQDSSFAGHGSYLSPAHGSAHHSVSTSTPASLYSAYQHSQSSTPERPGSGHHTTYSSLNKQEPGQYLDERGRIRMMPHGLGQQSGSTFGSNPHVRPNSPGRYIKSEKDMVSYSPGSSGSPAHHSKHPTQANPHLMYMKHP